MTDLIQINNWRTIFEDVKSLKSRERASCIVPNKQGGAGYSYLIGLKDGEALYGAFHALILLLSKQPCGNRDGYLTINGTIVGVRYTADYIAQQTLFKESTITKMLDEIVKNIGWATNHSNPENPMPVTYPNKTPSKMFIEMSISYHDLTSKGREYDPEFMVTGRDKLDREGAIALDTLHHKYEWGVDQIKTLLAWMPTEVFWEKKGAKLNTLLKFTQGTMKAVSAMDAMGASSNNLLSPDQMVRAIDKEGLTSDDFESMGAGKSGEMQWRRK